MNDKEAAALSAVSYDMRPGGSFSWERRRHTAALRHLKGAVTLNPVVRQHLFYGIDIYRWYNWENLKKEEAEQ